MLIFLAHGRGPVGGSGVGVTDCVVFVVPVTYVS